MTEFKYTARNKEGGQVTDVIEAPSRETAGQLLRQQGLLPTSLRQEQKRFAIKASLPTVWKHVSLLEKLTFVKNLAVTVKAGLPLARALGVLARQTPNPYFQEILGDIAHSVEGGKALSESMQKYPRIFPPIFANMVKAGEEAGTLDQNLEYLGRQIMRDYNLIRRTRGALIYPSVVFASLLVIGYIMFTFVLPRLTSTFAELGGQLPVLTRAIIGVVGFFSRHPVTIGLGIPAAAAALWLGSLTASGREAVHKINLTLPLVGTIVKKVNLARFTIIFSGLLHSGISIVEALASTSLTVTNIYYRRALSDASEKVKIGIDLVAALEKYPDLFTPMVTQMIAVGEESGTLEKVLAEVGNFYEAEVDDTVKNLATIIEPVLVILIGAVVGVLAVGLILPIYNIGQNI